MLHGCLAILNKLYSWHYKTAEEVTLEMLLLNVCLATEKLRRG